MAKCKLMYNGKEVTEEELDKYLDIDKNPPIIDRILQDAENIVTIEDNNGDKKRSVNGNVLRSVTNDVIPEFSHTKFKTEAERLESLASKYWKEGISEDVKFSTEEFGSVNKKEFIRRKKNSNTVGQEKGIMYGNILAAYFDSRPDVRRYFGGVVKNFVGKENAYLYNWLFPHFKDSDSIELAEKSRTKIIDSIGWNIQDEIEPKYKDKIFFELEGFNDILGWVFRPDILSVDKNGLVSIGEIKAGKKLREERSIRPLKYGQQVYTTITDNQLPKAKLQAVLQAFALKVKYPDMKFKDLYVLHIPNEYYVNNTNPVIGIHVQDYLNMIELWLKNEEKEVYEKLKELPHFDKLFDSKEYNTAYKSSTMKSMDTSSHNSYERMSKIIAQLKTLTTLHDDENEILHRKDKVAQEIKELTEELIELRKVYGHDNITDEDFQLSAGSLILGTESDINNPFVRILSEFKNEKKQQAIDKYETEDKAEFVRLLDIVYKEWLNKSGKASSKIPLIGNSINFTNPKELFKFAYLDVRDDSGQLIDKRLATSEEDYSKIEAEHNIKITKAQKNLVKFINDKYKSVLTGDAYVAKKNLEILIDGVKKTYSMMDIQNGEHSKRANRRKFTYRNGFFPMFQKTDKELNADFSWENARKFIKEKWKRDTTLFYENLVDEWQVEDNVIPIKGLGSLEWTLTNSSYSLDLAEQYTRFMKNIRYKEAMDDVMGLAKAMQIYVKLQNQSKEKVGLNPTGKSLVSYIETVFIQQGILGKYSDTLFGSKPLLTNTIIPKKKSGYKRFSWPKFLLSLKRYTSNTVMFANVPSGTANAIFITMMTIHKGISGSIAKRSLLGVDKTVSQFTLGSLWKAKTQYFGMIRDEMQGKAHKNKTYLLAKKLRYLADYSSFRDDTSSLSTFRNRAFSSDLAYAPYSMPEKFIAVTTMVAQLKSMKLKNGKTMWDMYNVVEESQPDGSIRYVLKYGVDSNGKKIDGAVRGVMNMSNLPGQPDYREITEITPQEAENMRYIYQRIHGGYREDEKTYLEYYVAGQLVLHFRKYLPSIIKNVLMSKGKRAQGHYEVVGKDEQGNDIIEWKYDVIEGRFFLLTKFLLSYFINKLPEIAPNTSIGKYIKENYSNLGEYQWKNLEVAQKELILEALYTIGMFGAMYIGYLLMFKDVPDDDQYKKYYLRIMNDVKQQYSVKDMVRMATEPPVTAKNIAGLIEAAGTTTASLMLLTAGNEEDALTRDGRLKGFTKLTNRVPYLKGIKMTYSLMENDQNPDPIYDWFSDRRQYQRR